MLVCYFSSAGIWGTRSMLVRSVRVKPMRNTALDRIVVIGGGGHAKVLISVLRRLRYDVVGYTDPVDRGPILSVPHLGGDEILPGLLDVHGRIKAAIGLGKVDASAARIRLWEKIQSSQFDLPIVVSTRAAINDEVRLGAGSVAFDGAVVNSGTTAGELCIVNTNSTVEHDCRLGDNVHIASGAVLSGGVAVGSNCMIGAGSTVVQGVTICAGCMVGAGSTVLRNIDAPGTYVGSPARKISATA
jgi:sugar O-acyltransferase (sialic acid O-acetyltransferase NeuD family)